MMEEQHPNESHDTNTCLLSTKILIAYIYLTKGIAFSIASTMPYVYPHIPPYSLLALFAAIMTPLSVKFLFAPIQQRYSFPAKGKRKWWVVGSLILTGIMICITSRWTDIEQAKVLIGLLMVSSCGTVMLEIALDSLAIKEIKSPEQTTTIQFVGGMVGTFLGSMTLLKFTSQQFADKFDMPHPITTPAVMIGIFGILLLLPVPYLVCCFKETVLQSQLTTNSTPLCKVISHYRYFFDLSTRYCRMSIFFLFVTQGTLFFAAGYEFQLVKAGFSRDDLNTIRNCVHLPVCLILSKMTDITNYVGKRYSWIALLIILVTIDAMRLWFFPMGVVIVGIIYFTNTLFYSWKVMIKSLMINELPVHAYSGMFLTMANSFSNMGANHMLHTKLIDIFGFKICAWVGLFIQLIVIWFIPRILTWIQEGDMTLNIEQTEEDGEFIEAQETKEQNKIKQKLQNQQELNAVDFI